MSVHFPLLLDELASITDPIIRQFELAGILAEFKKLESENRDKLAAEHGDGSFSTDYFSVTIKTPERSEPVPGKIDQLIEAGWQPDIINAVFPVKHTLNKKALAKHPGCGYAVVTKFGKATVKIECNQD